MVTTTKQLIRLVCVFCAHNFNRFTQIRQMNTTTFHQTIALFLLIAFSLSFYISSVLSCTETSQCVLIRKCKKFEEEQIATITISNATFYFICLLTIALDSLKLRCPKCWMIHDTSIYRAPHNQIQIHLTLLTHYNCAIENNLRF